MRKAVITIVLVLLVSNQYIISQKWLTVGNENFTPKFIFTPSIALDKNNVPYVVYCDSGYIGVTVKKYNGTNWVTIGDRGFSGERPNSTSIAIDSNGIPYVLYMDGNRNATVQKYNGTNWEIVGGSSMSYGIATKAYFAIDKNNSPYVAYFGETSGTSISKSTVKKFNGSNWIPVGVQGFTDNQVCSLVVDKDDIPYILCAKDTSDQTTILSVMKYNNTDWELVARISDRSISAVSTAIDKNGIMYVAYINGYGYINVIKLNGSISSKINTNLIGTNPSIAIDKEGFPNLLYIGNGTGAVLSKYDGNNWQNVGDSLFLYADADVKLAISEQNIPYVTCIAQSRGLTVKKYDVVTVKTDTLLLPNLSCSVECKIQSNTNWNVTVDKSWLSVSPTSGSGNGSFILTAEANYTKSIRSATVNITDNTGSITNITHVFQDSIIKKINIEVPGSLHTNFNQVDKEIVTSLSITGTIDARDFKFIRDSLSRLTVLDLSGATVVAYEGTEGTYSTASTVYNAMTIPQRAFYNYNTGISKTTLATVVLPINLISIDAIAFYGCNGLISINIPPTVTVIGKSAFYGCSNLNSIDLPVNLTSIGNYAFDNCNKITSIKFPDGLISIGNYAFENCSGLKGSLYIPNSVTSIGDYAFNNCSALDGSLTLSTSLNSIAQGTFYNCTGLSDNLFIPSSVTTIGKLAFYNCKGFTGGLSIPNTVTKIGESAFGFCHSLSGELKLPVTLLTIENSTFNECGNITSVVIPPTVTSIGNYAFMACDSLKTISIPSSVKTIGNQSFSGCKKLSSVYVFSTTPIDLSSSSVVFYGSNITNCILYVPVGSKAAYQNAAQWKDFTNIVEMTTATPVANEENISLYLSPASDVLHIRGISEVAVLKLFDMSGRLVVNRRVRDEESVPVSALSKGVYIVKLITVEGTMERKIIMK